MTPIENVNVVVLASPTRFGLACRLSMWCRLTPSILQSVSDPNYVFKYSSIYIYINITYMYIYIYKGSLPLSLSPFSSQNQVCQKWIEDKYENSDQDLSRVLTSPLKMLPPNRKNIFSSRDGVPPRLCPSAKPKRHKPHGGFKNAGSLSARNFISSCFSYPWPSFWPSFHCPLSCPFEGQAQATE